MNGIIVPLRYALRNGDTVEILTSANQKPSKDWLKFVVTSRARTRIRHFLRMEQRERSRQLGRDLLARELRKREPLAGPGREGRAGWTRPRQRLRAGTADDLLVAVGYGKVTAGARGRGHLSDSRGDAAPRTPAAAAARGTAGLRRRPGQAVGRRACGCRARRTSW